MNNTDKVLQYVDKLAEKLGVAAEKVYGLMIRQQIAEGIGGIIFDIVLIAILIMWLSKLYPMLLRKFNGDWLKSNDDMVRVLLHAISAVAAVAFICSIYDIKECVLHLMNPGYYVIKDILEAVK